MMVAASHEKRTNNRAPLVTSISWTVNDGQWNEATSQDISPTGMMLRTPQAIAPDSTLTLQFKLPNLKFQDPIVVEAEAVRLIQRHGQQIGVGLRFLSIRSHNYLVVQEFVCRILGLPLAGGMAGFGSQDAAGGYTFTMERLAREAETKRAEKAAQKMAQAASHRRQLAFKTWGSWGIKVGLLLLGLLIVYEGITSILALATHLQGLTN